MSGIPVGGAEQAGPVGLQGAELMWVGLQEVVQACFHGVWLSNVDRVSWGGVEYCGWGYKRCGQCCGCGFRGRVECSRWG